ncbi:MAG: dihydrolipoamide acetyltransferase component of pyruvate dehydrogenase complex [Bacteroidia bacterium]|nr:MAG: dihydrolipoamide acetyltransferase component of pyruvate dehydrogenase complex [Bacteroidia bacterium]
MAQQEITMPKMGESVMEATITKWVKNEGDYVKIDETIVEIATDKVDSEVPSPVEGYLVKKLYKEGDVVQVGKPFAILSTEKDAPVSEKPSTSPTNGEIKKTELVESTASQVTSTASTTEKSSRFYSPLVKTIAKKEGISMAELDQIQGSGLHGRVTKNDVLNYLEKRVSGNVATQKEIQTFEKEIAQPSKVNVTSSSATSNIEIKRPAVPIYPGDEIIEMDRMRKLIADHMVMSKHVSPHVTSFVEADVTNIVLWREKVKKQFEKRENQKITYTPIFIECIIKALKDFPMINVSVDETQTKIIKRKNINIGMATALPNGNLIVPVIKNADEKNLIGLTKAVNDLAQRARENKLQPDEIQGGTFTLTNVGNFGNVMGTPIINQPQVAILATGTIKKKPAVIETPQGDMIAIRHMMFLSLSYDHRVVDGSLGGSFLRRVADYLEAWDVNREI